VIVDVVVDGDGDVVGEPLVGYRADTTVAC
jgi:hypothetical protein